jgi:hypothetical protein
MTAIRRTRLAAGSALLFACGSPPPPPPPAPVAPRPPPESIAGTWRGSSTRFQADNRSCPHPGLVTLRRWEDRFQYRWDYKTWIDVTIDPDGSVHGEAPGITLVGRRTGNRIEGDVTNGPCGLHFTVTKQGK